MQMMRRLSLAGLLFLVSCGREGSVFPLSLRQPVNMLVDPVGRRLIILERSDPDFVSVVDYDAMQGGVVQGYSIRLDELSFADGVDFTFCPDTNSVLVWDIPLLISVSLLGAKRLLVDFRDPGSLVVGAHDIAVDCPTRRVLMLTSTSLVALHMDTRVWSVVSDATTGTGPELSFAVQVLVDDQGRRAIVVDAALGQVLSVDLDNGDRSVLFDPGDGPELSRTAPRALVALDAAGERLFLSQRVHEDGDLLFDAALVTEVDLATGVPRLIRRLAGPDQSIRGLAYDPIADRLILGYIVQVDFRNAGELRAMDIETGNVTVLATAAPTGR